MTDAAPPRAASWVSMIWIALLLVVGASPLVNLWAVPQNLDDTQTQTTGVDDPAALFVLKVRGIVVLGTALAGTLYVLAAGKAHPGGHAVFAASLVMAATPFISGVFGLEPELRGTLLVLPIVFLTVYVLPPISLDAFATQVKRLIIFYTYGSLAAAVVAPERVLESAYTAGWIPGFGYRMHGLGLHANGIAPFMVVYFLLRWFYPGRTRGVTIHDLFAGLLLVLAQSKMALATLGLVSLLALAELGRLRLSWARWPVIAFTVLLAVFMTAMGAGLLTELLPTSSDSNTVTLTGRSQVWRETMYLWEQNPWFGYGPGLWDAQMQGRYQTVLGWAPPQAHSQFFQTLGESGLVGIGGLIIYLTTLTASALWLGARYTAAPCFVILLIARGITEPTLEGNLDGTFVVHFWAFTFLVLAFKQRALDGAGERDR
jgi:O-antigen ligase